MATPALRRLDPRVSALAARAARGDEAALDELLRALRPMVVRVARLLAGSGTWIAEDAAQEGLIDITRGIGGLRSPTAVEAWALRIVVARVSKILRQEHAHRYSIVAELWEPADEEAGRMLKPLAEAFYELPLRLRAVAILRLYLGLSEAETAQILGCSVGTAKSQLHDARHRLASRLDALGIRPVAKAEVSQNG